MKNILKVLFMAVAMIMSLASCRDNAEIPDHGPVVHPQEDVKGTYNGNWTRSEIGSDEVLSGTGALVFTPGEYNYVTNIEATSAELEIDLSSPANITPGAEGYVFSNTVASNGFGAVFSGSINKSDMSVWLSFKKTVKVGIKSRTYIYYFEGKR